MKTRTVAALVAASLAAACTTTDPYTGQPKLSNTAGAAEVLAHPGVKAKFGELLRSFANASTGSSNRVLRATFLAEPPSLDVGEITDKGSINQRAVLKHRASLVNDLYAEPPPAHVITIDRKA